MASQSVVYVSRGGLIQQQQLRSFQQQQQQQRLSCCLTSPQSSNCCRFYFCYSPPPPLITCSACGSPSPSCTGSFQRYPLLSSVAKSTGLWLSRRAFAYRVSVSCVAAEDVNKQQPAEDDEEEPYPEDKPYSYKGDVFVKYESALVRREMAKVFEEWWAKGWAPWEETLAPENEFARDTLQKPSESRVSWDSFKKIHPPALPELIENRKKKAEETIQQQIDEFVEMRNKAVEMKQSLFDQPLVFMLLPPRDWPPPGWKVDAKELAYIREAYKLEAVRLSGKDMQNVITDENAKVSLDRWHTFMKQYEEWVAANKETLDREANQADPQYVPGRRRTGKHYEEGMYELPMIYPGQHYWGVVTCVHLLQGAFVYIGAVHDGLVQAQQNDWYYLQKYIKVGMQVHVEVIAKRDPYRYRFPIELRFVEPNVDKFIFNRFKYPPVIQRPCDRNLDEVAKDIKRPYIPERRPDPVPEVDPDTLIHPCIGKVWKVHQAEQMTLDAEENPEKNYDSGDRIGNQRDEDADDEDEREKDDCIWTKEIVNGHAIPKLVVNVDEKDLDLDTARTERQNIRKMWEAANARGEEFVVPRLRKEIWMDQLNEMHRMRAKAERAAHRRDIICRKEFGLPIEEPGKYVDNPYGKSIYNPRDIVWRKDYLGDISKARRKSRRDKQFRGSRFAKKVPQVEEVPKAEVVAGSTYIIQADDSADNGHWYISLSSEKKTPESRSSSVCLIDAFDCLSPQGSAVVLYENEENQDDDDDEDVGEEEDDDDDDDDDDDYDYDDDDDDNDDDDDDDDNSDEADADDDDDQNENVDENDTEDA